jgi:hypothetical protein
MDDTSASIVVGLASLVSFICFVMVIIQMLQQGAAGNSPSTSSRGP